MKAALRSIIVLYNGGWRRNPIPRPIPKRLCIVRSAKRINPINWIESNGPQGKFMIIRDDHSGSMLYLIINLKQIIVQPTFSKKEKKTNEANLINSFLFLTDEEKKRTRTMALVSVNDWV